ncbi:hypothetical protein HYX10_03540 [Candidatus Woesearchaeota archaeon]|nr:hypothetical protein [Candidatus Woesearchaeota archaeon]
MAKEKKVTIEAAREKGAHEVIKYMRSYINEPLEERMKALEEKTDPENEIDELFEQHAEHVVNGNPTGKSDDEKTGSYHAGVAHIEEVFKDKKSSTKLTKDEATSIMEHYVDKALSRIITDFKERIEKAKKAGLTEDEIRSLKGQLFAQHHIDPQTGRRLNPLEDTYLRSFRGKTKAQALSRMRTLADNSRTMYRTNLEQRATQDLFTEDDRMELADLLKPKFDKAGLKHPDHPYTKDTSVLIADIVTYLKSGDMRERGYSRKREPAEAAHK